MATHRDQHYVPAFLLRAWQSPTGKLREFTWGGDGRLIISERSARRVATLRHLYSARRQDKEPDVSLEKDYLGPRIDDPAAVVYAAILEGRFEHLEPVEVQVWSRFLVAQMIRVPSMVAHLRRRGRELLGKAFEDNPAEYDAVRGDADEGTLLEWVEKHQPHVFEDFGVGMLRDMVEADVINRAMVRSTWALLKLDEARCDLLIGDKPFLKIGMLDEDYLVAMPIAPKRLFVAYTELAQFRSLVNRSHTEIVRAANRSMVAQAEVSVYATNTEHEALVRKLLAKPTGVLLRR